MRSSRVKNAKARLSFHFFTYQYEFISTLPLGILSKIINSLYLNLFPSVDTSVCQNLKCRNVLYSNSKSKSCISHFSKIFELILTESLSIISDVINSAYMALISLILISEDMWKTKNYWCTQLNFTFISFLNTHLCKYLKIENLEVWSTQISYE